MATRSIQSAGVQISEVDLSLRPVQNNTTTVLIPGFSTKGPLNDAIQVASLSEYEQIYGTPSNGAERYFYQTVKAAFQSPASVVVTRLPYGSSDATTSTDQVGVLAYPAVYSDSSGVTSATDSQNYTQTSGVYMLGTPYHYTLSKDQFNQLKAGSLFTFSSACGTLTSSLSTLGFAALIVANQTQSVVNSFYEGYYIGITDNTNLNPACDFNSISKIKTLRNNSSFVDPVSYQLIPSTRYQFALSAAALGADGSLSDVLESSVPNFDIYSGREYDDTLVVGLFKLKQSVFSQNSIQLSFGLEEGYTGSLDSNRIINDPNGGPAKSFFLESVINNTSSNLVVKVNPYLSRLITGTSYLNINGTPDVKIRTLNPTLNTSNLFISSSANRSTIIGFDNVSTVNTLLSSVGGTDAIYPVGSYYSSDNSVKTIGSVPTKLNNIFDQLLNTDVYNINVVCEGGLGTVYACAQNNASQPGGADVFDDYKYVDVSALTAFDGNPVSNNLVTDYQSVVNAMQQFVENPARRDMIGILDPLTPILVQSNSQKTIKNTDANFTQNILWPLKNLYAPYNTSYFCSFPQVVKVADSVTGNPIWVPFSGFAAAIFANTDFTYSPWSAPAGFTRGIIPGVSDIAYYPRQKQRDQLYNSNFNPVTFFASDGFVIYGQKTLLKRPSAFDRINVRRLFLNLEVATRETLKYYVFEPNTLLTRTQVINTLTPIFENAKNTQGIYDYLIICDERNNTPAVIDDNTMVVDIYIKPVRTAEFILANFYATATSVNFQEIVS